MSKKQAKIDSEEMNKEMRSNLFRLVGDKHDAEDVAYVMADAYLRVQNLRLIGEKIYNGKKHIATLIECSHDGKDLKLRIRHKKPLHDVMLDFGLEASKDGKSSNKD